MSRNIKFVSRVCVFFLEHYFTLKAFDAVHEAFISDPEKDIQNRTEHWLVTKFWDIGSVYDR
jgi:hypothetical protein